MTDEHSETPFTQILAGEEPGVIIARDDEQRFALIASLEPEAVVHWLALPFEGGFSTEQMGQQDRDRFLALVDWAVKETQARIDHYPELAKGFTIKMHFGAYETIDHAKLHVLSAE